MEFSMERNSARHLSEVRDGMPEHVVHFDLTPLGWYYGRFGKHRTTMLDRLLPPRLPLELCD